MYPTVLYPTAVMVAIAAIAVVELFDITATTVIEIAQVLATTLAINVSVAISNTNFRLLTPTVHWIRILKRFFSAPQLTTAFSAVQW